MSGETKWVCGYDEHGIPMAFLFQENREAKTWDDELKNSLIHELGGYTRAEVEKIMDKVGKPPNESREAWERFKKVVGEK